MAIAGCGDEGIVSAGGQILVEGTPTTGGRLSLTPVRGSDAESDKQVQQPAVALVGSDGKFVLRTGGDSVGAHPGSYRILLVQDVDPSMRRGGASANQVATEELKIMYQSPSNKPLMIPAEGAEDLVIDVRRADGWTRSVSE